MLLRIAVGLGLLVQAACGFAPSPAERRPSFSPDQAAVSCEGDPSCRFLTPGEIRLAASIFGNRIDYAAIRIFDSPGGILGHITSSTALRNDIRIHDPSRYATDFSQAPLGLRGLFLHEMTHVWQYQSGRNFVQELLSDLARHGFDRWAVYEYALNQPRLSDYSTEQQAHMVATYHARLSEVSEVSDAGRRRSLCATIRAHEAVLATELPLQRSTICSDP
jgi:hypothetical protein